MKRKEEWSGDHHTCLLPPPSPFLHPSPLPSRRHDDEGPRPGRPGRLRLRGRRQQDRRDRQAHGERERARGTRAGEEEKKTKCAAEARAARMRPRGDRGGGGAAPPAAARAGASPPAHPHAGPRSHHPPCPSRGRKAGGGAVWTAAALKNSLDPGMGRAGTGEGGGLTRARRVRALDTWSPGLRARAKEAGNSPRLGMTVVGSWACQALRPGGALGKGGDKKKTRPPEAKKKKMHPPTHFFRHPAPPILSQPGESDLVMAKTELIEAVRERGAEGWERGLGRGAAVVSPRARARPHP